MASGTPTSAPSSSSSPARGGDDATLARRSLCTEPSVDDLRSDVGRSSAGVGTVGASLGCSLPATPASPKTEKNTESKPSACAWSDTNTERAVQYSRRRVIGRTSASARAKSAERSGVTGTPASRRRRLNAPASAGRSSSTVSTPNTGFGAPVSLTATHELLEASRADHLLVLAVLQYRSERPVHRWGIQPLDTEHAQGRHPIDRLGDSGWLLHVAVAHARDRVGDLHRQCRRSTLHAPAHDLDLALGSRVVDPVVQAAALHGIVEVTSPVGGQHDDRRMRGHDRAELGNRHTGLRQQLEQKRLE